MISTLRVRSCLVDDIKYFFHWVHDSFILHANQIPVHWPSELQCIMKQRNPLASMCSPGGNIESDAHRLESLEIVTLSRLFSMRIKRIRMPSLRSWSWMLANIVICDAITCGMWMQHRLNHVAEAPFITSIRKSSSHATAPVVSSSPRVPEVRIETA